MKKILKLLKSHPLVFLLILFLVFRLLFLTRLPIFNDEAIYLDWGYKALHTPGALFYSLVDGKQPFLMWVFGVSQSIFADPLLAGRLVAVVGGLCTLLGIFCIARQYYSNRIAVLASILYVIIPLFAAYDRFALMESAISACGVWSLYFLLRLLDDQRKKSAVMLGLVLGIGFFIKSSMLILLVGTLLILGWSLFQKRLTVSNALILSLIILCVFLGSILLLILQPMFWQTLSMNSRYSLTFSELLQIPLLHFFENLIGNIEILLVFITPLVAILGIIQGARLLKKSSAKQTMALWFFLTLLLQTLVVRDTTQRYVVSFLPLIVIFAALEFELWAKKLSKVYAFVLILFLFIPLIITLLQMTNPLGYITLTAPLTVETESGHVYGQVSGYGIEEIVSKIDQRSKNMPLVVATALNIGNPESAMRVYFQKSDHVKVGYLDKKMFGDALEGFECITPQVPMLYISRDYQQSDMNAYLEEIDRVQHPYSNYSLGIYQFKPCTGKSIELNPYILTQ